MVCPVWAQSKTKEFGDAITILGKNAGVHLVMQIKWPMKEEELIDRAYKSWIDNK